MTRCGDDFVHHATTCSPRDEVLWQDEQIGFRMAIFCQLEYSAASKSTLGSISSIQLKCGSGLLHQDGDLHAAVPDLRQS